MLVCSYLSINLSMYPSQLISTYLSIYISVYSSQFMYVYLSQIIHIYLSIYQSVCLSIYLSVCLSISVNSYLPIYLSIRINLTPFLFTHWQSPSNSSSVSNVMFAVCSGTTQIQLGKFPQITKPDQQQLKAKQKKNV